MKKFLMILGGIFAAVTVIVVGLIIYGVSVGLGLDSSSQEYVDEANKAIIKTWSEDALYRRASPEFSSAVTTEDVEKLFEMFRILGELEIYESAQGEAHVSMTTQNGKVITANYVAGATFEHGKAQITTRLIQHDGEWSILHFKLNSDAFIEAVRTKQ